MKRKPLTMKANEQYCLDFGQKNIDPTKCTTCGMMYVAGEQTDEKQHLKFHLEFSEGIKWPARLERPRKYFDDCSRILAITKNEQRPIYEAINKLLKISDGEMSAGDDVFKLINKDKRLFLIYVTNTNLIVGYICVEQIKEAYNLIDFSSSRLENEPVKCECAILYLWVHPSYRRRKIATHLVDVARANIKTHGMVFRSRVAVCDPTEAAIPFLSAYLHHKRPVKVYQPN